MEWYHLFLTILIISASLGFIITSVIQIFTKKKPKKKKQYNDPEKD